MISAKDLRTVQLSTQADGYSMEEVNAVIDMAAETVDALTNENQELYHKLEVLAARIEEYRSEEDSIKTALITAQKMADKITKESQDEADKLLTDSNAQAEATIADANEKAEQVIAQAREYTAGLVQTKTDEANGIVRDAEAKANEAISSAKIVAQDIVSQAKASYTELTTKAQEEKEAYEILIATLRRDAADFIDKLKRLYAEQFSRLTAANITIDETADSSAVDAIHSEASGLLSEMDEIESSIPGEIKIDTPASEEPVDAPAEEEPVAEVPAEDAPADAEEITDEPEEAPMTVAEEAEEILDELSAPVEAAPATDPMEAVAAFSQSEYTPPTTTGRPITEYADDEDEEGSLFDNGGEQPFERFFDVSNRDAHKDRTQQISLLPPDDDDDRDKDDDSHGFKGFFRKKK